MKSIFLSNGREVIVDDDVYLWASKFNWYTAGDYVYREVYQDGKPSFIYLHREIMDAPDDMEVDHQNHNTSDYQRSNLRLCTRSQNLMNQRPQRRTKHSKFKGVSRNCGNWGSYIWKQGRRFWLGTFPTEKVAALVYNKAAKLYHREFALLNIIDKDGDETQSLL